jgi:hypothetical protein
MSKKEGNFDSISVALKELGKLANTLAKGLEDDFLRAILIILIIFAFVTMIAFLFGIKYTLFIFAVVVVLCMVLVYRMFKLGLSKQKMQIENIGKKSIEMKKDTIGFVDRLSDVQKEDVRKILRGAATLVADMLNIPHNLVRSNLFGVDDQKRLRILKESTFHMDREEELTISMPVGYGSTGRCFQHKVSNIAVFREGWGKDTIDDQELRKVHPDLQWIISVPVLTGKDRQIICVMNVDGLQERREEEELSKVVSHLFHYSEIISYIIKENISKIRR